GRGQKDAEGPGNIDSEVPNTEEPRINQEKDANNTNNINVVSPTINATYIKDNVVDKNIVYGCADDPNMLMLEEIVYSDDDDEEVGAEADMTNLDTYIPVSPIPTTKIYKDHPVKQIIRDIHSAPQTRRITKNVTNLGFEDPEFPDRVYKVEKALYGLHQAFRAWSTRKEMCIEFEKMMHK
nr:retrotransposon protein, putative, unclassified [Tanacetum cinerariifolium]